MKAPTYWGLFLCGSLIKKNSVTKSSGAEKMDTLWEEVTRFENPHKYYVDFTYDLWQLREDMLMRHRV